MQTRCLGNTGLEVSIVGLGTVKFGRTRGVAYSRSFTLPTDKEVACLLSKASGLGINVLDTAPSYGASEARLGKALLGQRHRWVVSSKVGEAFVNGKSSFDFSLKAIRKSIELSLTQLCTDYLDIVFVHSNGEDQRLIEEEEVFSSLAQLKSEGKVRAYGMSTKTVVGGLLAVDHADVVMVTYNPASPDEREVIRYAHQHQKGTFIKKALARGHLHTFAVQAPIKEAMRFVFAEPGVTSVIVGTIDPQHLEEDVQCAIEAATE